MLSGPRNDTVGMLSGLRNESVDELTQQHASHAVAGGTRSVRSRRRSREPGEVNCETGAGLERFKAWKYEALEQCDRCGLRAGCVDGA